jgi:hypothetical protein
LFGRHRFALLIKCIASVRRITLLRQHARENDKRKGGIQNVFLLLLMPGVRPARGGLAVKLVDPLPFFYDPLEAEPGEQPSQDIVGLGMGQLDVPLRPVQFTQHADRLIL